MRRETLCGEEARCGLARFFFLGDGDWVVKRGR